jgi:hypothetical protein
MAQLITIWTLELAMNNFFAFPVSFSLGFFELPPSRHHFILFFLCRPTTLLRTGAPISNAKGTFG